MLALQSSTDWQDTSAFCTIFLCYQSPCHRFRGCTVYLGQMQGLSESFFFFIFFSFCLQELSWIYQYVLLESFAFGDPIDGHCADKHQQRLQHISTDLVLCRRSIPYTVCRDLWYMKYDSFSWYSLKEKYRVDTLTPSSSFLKCLESSHKQSLLLICLSQLSSSQDS